tara:strand:+ start:3016 stop:3279 length:264 start_codon:yes stop_codon:yes gene_type:complete
MHRYTSKKGTDRVVVKGNNKIMEVIFRSYDQESGDLIDVAHHTYTPESLAEEIADCEARIADKQDSLSELQAVQTDMNAMADPKPAP